MAENKKSFILYADLIHTVNLATDKQAGMLFKHILSYVNDENPVTKCSTTKILFEPVKQQLKRDLVKYTKKKVQWSDAGKRSAEVRKVKKNQRTLTDVNERSTDSTVNVNDTVNVTVNVNDNDINNIYNKFVDEVLEGKHSQATEQMYMRLKIKNGSLTPLLKDFKGQLIIDQTIHKNTLELRKHFNNWLNMQERVGKLDKYKTIKTL